MKTTAIRGIRERVRWEVSECRDMVQLAATRRKYVEESLPAMRDMYDYVLSGPLALERSGSGWGCSMFTKGMGVTMYRPRSPGTPAAIVHHPSAEEFMKNPNKHFERAERVGYFDRMTLMRELSRVAEARKHAESTMGVLLDRSAIGNSINATAEAIAVAAKHGENSVEVEAKKQALGEALSGDPLMQICLEAAEEAGDDASDEELDRIVQRKRRERGL